MAELDAIWAVTDRYVETGRPLYEEKLRALPEIALWRTRRGTVVGLASLDVYHVTWNGRTSAILFTSNVVVDERHRRRNLVLRTGVRVTLREKLRRPWVPTFWLFDTFSYKSYVLMSHNFADFWPRRDRAMPEPVAGFIDFLARRRYGGDWSAASGVVRGTQKRLRSTAAHIDATALADPDVRFFESANPGHEDGDMLVCLAPLTARNFVGATFRAIIRSRRPRPRA